MQFLSNVSVYLGGLYKKGLGVGGWSNLPETGCLGAKKKRWQKAHNCIKCT